MESNQIIPNAILEQIEGKKIKFTNNYKEHFGVCSGTVENGTVVIMLTSKGFQKYIHVSKGWTIEIYPNKNLSESRFGQDDEYSEAIEFSSDIE